MHLAGAAWGSLVHPSLQLPSQPSSVQDGACLDGRQLCGCETTQPGRSLSSAHDPGFPQGWLPTWCCAMCHRSYPSCAVCASCMLHVSFQAMAFSLTLPARSYEQLPHEPTHSVGVLCNQQACLVNIRKRLFTFLCVAEPPGMQYTLVFQSVADCHFRQGI